MSMLTHFTDLDGDLAIGSFPHDREHVAFLAEAGVRAVVNLQSDEDLGVRGIEWSLMWQLYTQHRILVTRVPVIDHAPDDLATSLGDAVEAIADYVGRGRKVYVHCTAGLNRSVCQPRMATAARAMPCKSSLSHFSWMGKSMSSRPGWVINKSTQSKSSWRLRAGSWYLRGCRT